MYEIFYKSLAIVGFIIIWIIVLPITIAWWIIERIVYGILKLLWKEISEFIISIYSYIKSRGKEIVRIYHFKIKDEKKEIRFDYILQALIELI